MVTILALDAVKQIIKRKGLKNFFLELIARLQKDFSRWNEFNKTPRHATHYPHGVIELMPISDQQYYVFKYVNGHPSNPKQNKLTVAAIGLLAEVDSGYPLLISEMTLLTAIRTACTSTLASKFLAKPKAKSIAMIGTGSQAEFQILAHHFYLGINKVFFYDKDPAAMGKLAHNLQLYELELLAGKDIVNTIEHAEIVTTATAAKAKVSLLKNEWIKPGMHINAIGGDCPGKTELDPKILMRSKIVVENFQQTRYEGEIQNLENVEIYAELWEIVNGKKPARSSPEEIFIFDSVGFALEDFTILKYIYDLAQEYKLGNQVDLIPQLRDPRNLFSLLS